MRKNKPTSSFGWPKRLGLVPLALTLCAAMAIPAWAAGYPVAVGDKLTVRVVEWQAAEANFQELAQLGGAHTVGEDGTITFPFLGPIKAAGSTTTDLAASLSAALQKTLGFTSAPDVSVEISDFAPIFVTGSVQSPGSFPFAPGLNVVKAFSLAGGERRASSSSNQDLANLQGTYELLRGQELRLKVQLARLDAELAQKSDITLPPEIAKSPGVEELVAKEKAVMAADGQAISLQASASKQLVDLNNKQIENLAQKRQNTNEQLQLAQTQFNDVQKLAQNGLAVAARVQQLQTTVAQLQGQLLDIDTGTLQAQQAISDAQNQQAAALNKQMVDLGAQREDIAGQVADTEVKLVTQQNMINEAVAFGAGTGPQASTAPTLRFQIMRGNATLDATPTTALQPGDVVIFSVALSD